MNEITVRQAKKIATKWVLEHGSKFDGFEGAFFHGSINWMNDDDVFPESSDVDLALVSGADPLPKSPRKLRYCDVLLEIGVRPASAMDDVEETLGNHRTAGTFSKDCVIVDTTGRLDRLHAGVSHSFSDRKWALERCDKTLTTVNAYLDALSADIPFYEQVTVLSFGAGNLADLLTVAGLRNTTVRKKYAVARDLLVELGRRDVYETLLRLLGCADFTKEQVSDHLNKLSAVFDAACEIDKTGYRFGSDISASARSIAIGGSQELIDQGHHRDAVFWLLATYSRCMTVFDQYGAEGDLVKYRSPFDELLVDLELDSFEKRMNQKNLVQQAIPAIWQEVETMIAENPAIGD